ncbi:biotin--[acetyl-CoA-carboxylase] ligase [Listeria costaricensis]|uniref:biotin--[acetyl-CoA-carboxylase] ligase n=1 Tax=Listeria costaricensis TaxID=2026604 RepID=UPI000C06DBBD|nr:biotin--[acetyl-CoA-carboxylase] ligase [Listeria costaricensis]
MAKTNREKLLAYFGKRQDEFISGQQIADLLGCSRTAVWKHMENLRKEGYDVEAVRNKGYRLHVREDQFSKEAIQLGLGTSFIGQQMHVYESVPSTQLVAHQEVSNGAESGTVIISDEQTTGKGRLLRPWDSQKGHGIWMSVILKPRIEIRRVPQFTFIASLAVSEAVSEITGLEPRIKWPNDLYLGKKKICGVLTEMQAEAETIHAVIIGIGLNVGQENFPEELREKATSLRIEGGKTYSRQALIQAILFYLEKYYLLFDSQGFQPIKLLWEERAIPFQQRVRVSTLRGTITGISKGISEEGVLLIEDDHGEIHPVYSADIEIE